MAILHTYRSNRNNQSKRKIFIETIVGLKQVSKDVDRLKVAFRSCV